MHLANFFPYNKVWYLKTHCIHGLQTRKGTKWARISEQEVLSSQRKGKKTSLSPLNQILVLHLGQGINFLTMLYIAKVTLLRKPQYLWTFMLSTTYCRPLHGTHQKKKSHMNFRCMKSEPPWRSITTLLTAT